MYLFTGTSDYLIQEGYKKWKSQFIEKYGDFNCVDIKEPQNLRIDTLSENLLSTSFLAEKKLIIIHLDSKISDELEGFLLNNFKRIPDENIVLFVYPKPDKRKKLYKKISSISEIKEFHLESDQDNYNYFKTLYKESIQDTALRKLISYKSNNSNKIASAIEKLLINHDTVTDILIDKYIVPEFEENIFKLINNILYKNRENITNDLHILLHDTSVYALYNSLVANLRTHIYIMQLQKNKIQNIDTILQLGNRKFLLNKSYPISYSELLNIFIKLVNIDKKMKTGKLLGSEDQFMLYEIEKILLM